jgi:hypothetical protein
VRDSDDGRWWLEFVPEGRQGHKYFWDLKTNQIAVADESGDTPDKTGDGPLYLDRSRTITFDGDCARIPLFRPGGAKTTTPCGVIAAWAVAERFNMRIVGVGEGINAIDRGYLERMSGIRSLTDKDLQQIIAAGGIRAFLPWWPGETDAHVED